jgi:hypothetical protein
MRDCRTRYCTSTCPMRLVQNVFSDPFHVDRKVTKPMAPARSAQDPSR